MKAIKTEKNGECLRIKDGKPPYTLKQASEGAFRKNIFVFAIR
jgi:hypothetical protein